ncbi:p23 chaperone protein wos2, partial [Coemansia asiatica]
HHPTVLWAQCKDTIYLTIDLHNMQNMNIDLQPNSIDFKNTTDKQDHAFHSNFYKLVSPKESKKSTTGHKMLMVLKKAEGEWWPHLTKELTKLNFLKTDFNHWVNEDKSEDKASMVPTGMDFLQIMGGMGGMGSLGGLGNIGGADGSFEDAADEEEDSDNNDQEKSTK